MEENKSAAVERESIALMLESKLKSSQPASKSTKERKRELQMAEGMQPNKERASPDDECKRKHSSFLSKPYKS